MGLFDQILGAIEDPSRQGSTEQLGGVLDAIGQLNNDLGTDSSTSQTLVSGLGGYVRSALQEKRATEGEAGVQSLLNQFGGTNANPMALASLFGGGGQQQIANELSQRTGIPPQTILAALPILVPLVLNLLQTGNTQNPQAGNNNVLSAFLDGDRDGDVDLGDVIGMAGQFLNR